MKTRFKNEITKAYQRIKPYIQYTPLIKAHALSNELKANIYLKLENIQITSAFKIRGAFNKLLSLAKSVREKGVVAASTGNHGAAVAFACQQLGINAKIFVPKHASTSKLAAIKLFGAEIEFYGNDCGDSEKYARAYAKKNNLEYFSPYNDVDIMYGQGTIGYEINEQLEQIDQVYIAVGGGGLISGIAGYLKAINPDIQIIGCLPENSPVMYECIKAGKIIELESKPTLSDATAGNIDLDSITFAPCQKYIDEFILVSETEIKKALLDLLEKEHQIVEGAAAVALAAARKNKTNIINQNIIIIICGGNLSIGSLKQLI